MLRISISLFITGIILGSGPCLATCGPILIGYIAGTRRSPLAGLWCWALFSITRVFIYIFLGLIAGLAGSSLFQRFYWELPGYIIWLLSGLFISLLGLLIFLGSESHYKLCRLLNDSLVQKDTKSLITLGVFVGIFPCVPLIGVLSYITMASTHFTHGIIMSAAFGLGTLISPLVLLGMLAGAIPKLKVLQEENRLRVFQKISGLVLVFLGAHIIMKTLLEYLGRV